MIALTSSSIETQPGLLKMVAMSTQTMVRTWLRFEARLLRSRPGSPWL